MPTPFPPRPTHRRRLVNSECERYNKATDSDSSEPPSQYLVQPEAYDNFYGIPKSSFIRGLHEGGCLLKGNVTSRDIE